MTYVFEVVDEAGAVRNYVAKAHAQGGGQVGRRIPWSSDAIRDRAYP